MKIDLNRKPRGLDGVELEKADSLGKHLANMLVSTSQGQAIKHYEWALSLFADKPIDLDTADQEYLKGFIEKSDTSSILIKAQILMAFKK